MSKPIDYTRLSASLDYAAIDKKLTQLSERQPPKKRKNAADVLEPLRERLLALHQNGWSSRQLAEELKAAGIPISSARLRDCLNGWSGIEPSASKRRARRPAKPASNVAPTPSKLLTSQPTATLPKKPVIAPQQSPFTFG